MCEIKDQRSYVGWVTDTVVWKMGGVNFPTSYRSPGTTIHKKKLIHKINKVSPRPTNVDTQGVRSGWASTRFGRRTSAQSASCPRGSAAGKVRNYEKVNLEVTIVPYFPRFDSKNDPLNPGNQGHKERPSAKGNYTRAQSSENKLSTNLWQKLMSDDQPLVGPFQDGPNAIVERSGHSIQRAVQTPRL